MERMWLGVAAVAMLGAGPPRPDPAEALPPGALWRQGSLRLVHRGDVEMLAFSADGKTLLSGGPDAMVMAWDVATGRQKELLGLTGLGVGLQSFSQAGRLLLLCDKKGKAYLVDLSGPRLLRSWAMPPGNNSVVAVAPDGSLVARLEKGSDTVGLIDPYGKKPLRRVGKVAPGSRMALSPGGREIATAEGAAASLYSVVKQKPLRLREQSCGGVRFIAFTGNGKALVSVDDIDFQVCDPQALEIRRRWNTVPLVQFAGWAVPDKIVGTLNEKGMVHFWDVGTGKVLRKVSIPGMTDVEEEWPEAVAFSERLVATVGWFGEIELWDARTGRRALPRRKPVLAAGFTATGRQAVVVQPGRVQWRDVRTGALERELPADIRFGPSFPPAQDLLSPNGDKIVHGLASGGYSLGIDLLTGKPLPKAEGERSLFAHRFFADGRTVLCTAFSDDRIRLYDVRTGKYRSGPAVKSGSVFLADDDRTLYVPSAKGEALDCWDVVTAKKGAPLKVAGIILASCRRGRRLAVSTSKGVEVLDLPVGGWSLRVSAPRRDEVEEAEGQRDPAIGVRPWATVAAFSPNGDWLVFDNSTFGDVEVWDLRAGRRAARLFGHRNAVKDVNWAPSGKRFLTLSTDGTVLAWDLSGVLRGAKPDAGKTAPVGRDRRAGSVSDGRISCPSLTLPARRTPERFGTPRTAP